MDNDNKAQSTNNKDFITHTEAKEIILGKRGAPLRERYESDFRKIKGGTSFSSSSFRPKP